MHFADIDHLLIVVSPKKISFSFLSANQIKSIAAIPKLPPYHKNVRPLLIKKGPCSLCAYPPSRADAFQLNYPATGQIQGGTVPKHRIIPGIVGGGVTAVPLEHRRNRQRLCRRHS